MSSSSVAELRALSEKAEGFVQFITQNITSIQKGQWNDMQAVVHDLSKAISMLRVMQNSLIPVSQLPPDVLVQIFQHLRSRRSKGGVFTEQNSISTVSAVCRSWRQAAYDAATLWSDVSNFHSMVEFHHFFVASRGAPLNFSLKTRASSRLCGYELSRQRCGDCDFLADVAQHSQRLRSLRLVITPHLLPKHFLRTINAFQFPTPQLQALTIALTPIATSTYGRAMLPNTLFQASTPALRKVTLHCKLRGLPAGLLKNLTHLRIHELDLSAIDGILQVLHFNPRLQVLILGSDYPDDIDRPITLPPVRLDSLQLCSFVYREATHREKFITLLKHMIFPASARRFLWGDIHYSRSRLSYALPTCVLSNFATGSAPFGKEKLCLSGAFGADYDGSDHRAEPWDGECISESVDSLQLYSPSSLAFAAESALFTDIEDGFAASVKYLTVGGDRTLGGMAIEEAWTNLDRVCPNVEELCLGSDEVRSIIPVLFSASAISGIPVFPCLQTLRVFSEIGYTDLGSVIELVRQRVDMGAPLQELELSCYRANSEEQNISKTDLMKLKALVPRFTWMASDDPCPATTISNSYLDMWPPPGFSQRYLGEDYDCDMTQEEESGRYCWANRWGLTLRPEHVDVSTLYMPELP